MNSTWFEYIQLSCVLIVLVVVLRWNSAETEVNDEVKPWILFSDQHHVWNMSAGGLDPPEIHQSIKYVLALDYDIRDKMVYYVVEEESYTIYRSHVRSNKTEVVFQPENSRINSIAVDWIGRKLYWVDSDSSSIEVAKLNGAHRKTLMTGVRQPGGIAVHPMKGLLFYTSSYIHPYMGRMNMDGTENKMIVTWKDGLNCPKALTIDYAEDRLYFVEWCQYHIESVDLDGKNRISVLRGVRYMASVVSLSVFQDHIYYTDSELSIVAKSNKMNGSADWEILRNLTDQPFALQVYHPLRQVGRRGDCNDGGGCSHLCLLNPTNKTCACPSGFVLEGDRCIANCTTAQHACIGGGNDRCIPHSKVCDGVIDCQGDESDEKDCPERVCKADQFQCKNKNCTTTEETCNEVNDCGDNSEEEICGCAKDEFKCKFNGKCIPNCMVCDGVTDCYDDTMMGSDEDLEACQLRTCNPETEFECDNGRCIPVGWKCNQSDECDGDGSDEPVEFCMSRNCTKGMRKCPTGGEYICLFDDAFCSGYPNCKDGSDEMKEHCPECDPDQEFTCANGSCIPNRMKCDMEDNCRDNSDELPETCGDLGSQAQRGKNGSVSTWDPNIGNSPSVFSEMRLT